MPFPTVALLDSFKRTEGPLGAEAGHEQWQDFYPTTSHSSKGNCNGASWETNLASSIEGSYWSTEEFLRPGASLEWNRIEVAGYWKLWACISHPTTSAVSGYCIKVKNEGSGPVTIEKCVEGAFTVLKSVSGVTWAKGDRFGITVSGGKVRGWKKPSGSAWEELLSATDSAYTTGFVGFDAEAQDGCVVNFEAGAGENETITAQSAGVGTASLTIVAGGPKLSPKAAGVGAATCLLTAGTGAELSPKAAGVGAATCLLTAGTATNKTSMML